MVKTERGLLRKLGLRKGAWDSDEGDSGTAVTRAEGIIGGWVGGSSHKCFLDKYKDGTYAVNYWDFGELVHRGERTTDFEQLLADWITMQLT